MPADGLRNAGLTCFHATLHHTGTPGLQHAAAILKEALYETLARATLPRDDLDRLYQWFIERRHGQALRLNRPIFGTHVTIVRHNENVPDMTAWGRYEGREVAIAYDVVLRNHYGFWSLPVYNEWFQEVRAELGLPPEPDFHITVGRQFDWQPIAHGARRDASDIRLERERRERTLSSYRLPGSSSELPTPSPVTIDSDVL